MAMNIGRSVKVALAKQGRGVGWLAEQFNTSPQNASRIANSESTSRATIEKLANLFEMSVSEFIALGE